MTDEERMWCCSAACIQSMQWNQCDYWITFRKINSSPSPVSDIAFILSEGCVQCGKQCIKRQSLGFIRQRLMYLIWNQMQYKTKQKDWRTEFQSNWKKYISSYVFHFPLGFSFSVTFPLQHCVPPHWTCPYYPHPPRTSPTLTHTKNKTLLHQPQNMHSYRAPPHTYKSSTTNKEKKNQSSH